MSSNRTLRDLPFGVGAAAGAAAWVLTYLFTYVITSSEIQNSIIGRLTDIPTWKAVGWVFYNAHFTSTIVDVPLVGGATNFIGGENGFTPLLYVIPPVLLLIAGLAVGRYAGAGEDTVRSALAGVTPVIGYGVLSVVGVFLFATQEPSVTPDAVTGILLAGIVYPVVFGAVGAVVAGLTASNGRPESTTNKL
ncbi:hypothetical protein [Halorarius litoreus]|uniref:hypothetical protein n=1 Tax=Halorarius litoreus TaxID=2962676 RepID=UPI0020CF5E43|nr:hypothetical protein [Halorarius litoreus]